MEQTNSFFGQRAPVLTPNTVHGRCSIPVRLTVKQSELLERLVDGKLTLGGREFTRDELMLIFKREQLPKSREMRQLLDVDFSN